MSILPKINPRPMDASETSPRLGAGVVMILRDFFELITHYDQHYLVLTLG